MTTNTSLSSTHNSSSASSSTPPRTVAKLRVQIIGARGLAGKDRNGLSDPFIIINLPGAPPPSTSTKKDKDYYRRTTPVQPKTLEPNWKETEATFEWDITSDWYQANRENESDGHTEEQVVKQDFAGVPEAGSKSTENAGSLKTPNPNTATHLTESPTIEVSEDPVETAEIARREAELKPPGPPTRPSNVRKISAATTKILAAPVRMTTKGAVATTRAVRRRGPPRPMRLRRGTGGTNKTTNGTVDPNAIQQHRGNVGAIEFVMWDKDKWSGNDYMGECSVQVFSWIAEGKSAAWDSSQPATIPLTSSRRNAKVSGEIIIKIGLVAGTPAEADEIYNKLLLASNSKEGAGIRSVPADQSVGTTGPSEAFVDDGLSSDSDSEAREELLSDEEGSDTDSDGVGESTTTEVEDYYDSDQGTPAGIPVITTSGEVETEVTTGDETTAVKDRQRRHLLPRRLRKSPSAVNSATNSDVGEEGSVRPKPKMVRVRVRRRRRRTQEQEKQGSSDSQEIASQSKQGRQQQRKKKQSEGKRKGDFAFKSELGMDIIGIVQMEVKGAQDLPRWKNSLGTGFDMDAFVIVSFGQRIFRTRVARHSLNPTWDEKLLFHVRQHESNFVTKLAIYDWDKLSANDFVGSTELKISELMEAAPKPNEQTGLFNASDDGMHDMKKFQLALTRSDRSEDVNSSNKSLGKHTPVLTIEAKFTPYSSLRQRFWRQLLTQYDTNDSGTLSNLELTSMLDSLGSTLTSKTIEGFFSQFDKKDIESDELTVDECIIALEREISKPWSEKRYVDKGWDGSPHGSGSQTPAISGSNEFQGDIMDYTGPNAPSSEESELAAKKAMVPSTVIEGLASNSSNSTPSSQQHDMQRGVSALSLSAATTTSSSSSSTASRVLDREQSPNSSSSTKLGSSSTDVVMSGDTKGEEQVERVIVLKSCPLCHMPRLSKKAEVDIVTHLAVCASQDWRRVDSMVVSNFVTASQAHRKWYTKVITKISQGQYQLGANSANIIVQDRMTGELLEEKMQVYVRLGIRLLYKGARSRMEGARIKRMLKNMSVKQGIKFDSPASAREIPQFIAFHKLNLDEVREPLESYKTFNEFFYRKLKEGARPIADANDPTTLVSSADCRLMAFSTITEATKIWIKGREFTVERLLGEKYKGQLESYQNGGSLVIFRLAPQDYHRFHCPADAIVEEITMIQGQYYTVNPMAIRSAIDVYGENIRAVVQFKSKEFGVFYCVCIGAMMVGSINLVVKEGDMVKRGDEFGYYAFGGSTNVCIFEQGRVELDDDLLSNSRRATETLVRVGMRIGKAAAAAATNVGR